MTFNDTSTPLSLLKTRRSGKPRDLIAPGPDETQIMAMIEIAGRTPDHGKLFPWRFVAIRPEDRAAFAVELVRIIAAEKEDCGPRDLEAAEQFALQAPALIVVLSKPVAPHKIPVWEQELSVGAACMNLLHAVHAMGFAGGWLTGWAAYSDAVRNLFGGEGEKIAGFMFIGTPARELEERPRPSLSDIAQFWTPGAGRAG